MAEITTLDPDETQQALESNRFGKTETMLSKIAASLMGVLDTESSVFVTGLDESRINSLRTRMYRKHIVITVRKVTRGGTKGHVIVARSIEA
jgi:hypothetical protein